MTATSVARSFDAHPAVAAAPPANAFDQTVGRFETRDSSRRERHNGRVAGALMAVTCPTATAGSLSWWRDIADEQRHGHLRRESQIRIEHDPSESAESGAANLLDHRSRAVHETDQDPVELGHVPPF